MDSFKQITNIQQLKGHKECYVQGEYQKDNHSTILLENVYPPIKGILMQQMRRWIKEKRLFVK